MELLSCSEAVWLWMLKKHQQKEVIYRLHSLGSVHTHHAVISASLLPCTHTAPQWLKVCPHSLLCFSPFHIPIHTKRMQSPRRTICIHFLGQVTQNYRDPSIYLEALWRVPEMDHKKGTLRYKWFMDATCTQTQKNQDAESQLLPHFKTGGFFFKQGWNLISTPYNPWLTKASAMRGLQPSSVK